MTSSEREPTFTHVTTRRNIAALDEIDATVESMCLAMDEEGYTDIEYVVIRHREDAEIEVTGRKDRG